MDHSQPTDALDGVSPLHNYLIFNLTQKHLQGVKVYVKDQQVLLDIQDMFMKLFGCSENASTKKNTTIRKGCRFCRFRHQFRHPF